MAQRYNYDITMGANKRITQDGSIVAITSSLAPDYSNLQFPIEVDALCTHEGKLYKCTVAIPSSESWDASHWSETTISDSFQSGSGGPTIYIDEQGYIAIDYGA